MSHSSCFLGGKQTKKRGKCVRDHFGPGKSGPLFFFGIILMVSCDLEPHRGSGGIMDLPKIWICWDAADPTQRNLRNKPTRLRVGESTEIRGVGSPGQRQKLGKEVLLEADQEIGRILAPLPAWKMSVCFDCLFGWFGFVWFRLVWFGLAWRGWGWLGVWLVNWLVCLIACLMAWFGLVWFVCLLGWVCLFVRSFVWLDRLFVWLGRLCCLVWFRLVWSG